MSTAATFDQLTFDPPGPGSWLLDSVHVPRPWSRFQAEIHPPNLAAGFRMGARRYGMLIDTLDWRMVNGFAYFSVPPAPQAEIPERFQAAEDAIAGKIWRDDMTRWEQEVKPAAITAIVSTTPPTTPRIIFLILGTPGLVHLLNLGDHSR